jgi:PleD family two-component response regulator
MISEKLPDGSGVELCRSLREGRTVTDSTAIFIIIPGPVAREARLAALRAGASDCIGLPVDNEELGMRLMPYIRAKFDADHARDQGLIDPLTGLYNLSGLNRRAREIGSQAYRHSSPLACVIFSPDIGEANVGQVSETIVQIAKVLNQAGRVSDAIGRVDGNKIAIFAPDAREDGIEKLMQRLQTAVERSGSGDGAGSVPPLQSGYFAVPNFRETPANFDEMLFKAGAALKRRGRSNGDLTNS